jgi:purine-binding chemotaxis protein CheW
MGIVVDSVSEVLNIGADAIEDSPDFGPGIETQFILGMGKTGDQVTILLDIKGILTGSEMDELARIKQTRPSEGGTNHV